MATIKVEVPADKASYISDLAKLGTDVLRILAEKSKKPGIEQKIKMYQNLI